MNNAVLMQIQKLIQTLLTPEPRVVFYYIKNLYLFIKQQLFLEETTQHYIIVCYTP